jgi:hypothetical protein
MKNVCVMKKMSMIVLAVAVCWAGGSVAQGFIVSNGLEAYLDFTVNPGGTSVIDKTGNGNNGTLVNGPDPDGAGPVTGVPHWDGTGVRFFGGWVDVDPSGSIDTLSSGTMEFIIDGMPITDNSISTGTPLSVANAGNTGRDHDIEVWLNHRFQPGTARSHFSGRAGAGDEIDTSYIANMQNTDGGQREQYFIQWDGGTNMARLVGRFNRNGSIVVDQTPWVGTGSMPDFLSAAINVRLGARNNGNAAMEAPHYQSEVNIFRVYDRILDDAEMLQNWDQYNAEIPEPATIGLLTLGGILGLRRRNRKQA